MVDSKKIKQRVKIGDTEYDIQFGINTIAGLDTILSSKMDKELTVGSFSANNNYLPLAVLNEDGKYYLKANTNFKFNSSKANYVLTQAGTWKLDNNHNHDTIYSKLGHKHDDRYYTESETNSLLSNKVDKFYSLGTTQKEVQIFSFDKADTTHKISFPFATGTVALEGHKHDDRYYTETEMNTLLSGKLGSNDNAVSASKLQTPRDISINGGVTGTATKFDGTSNIIIPITNMKESYLSFGGKNLSGSYGPIDASIVPELGANRLAFTPAGAIAIQYSKDGGTTWIDYGATDKNKIDLFSGIGTSLSIGKNTTSGVDYSNYQLRITLDTASQVYTSLNKFVVLCSTSGSSGSWITIDARLQSNYTSNIDTWTTFSDRTPISGWSGYNVINTSGLTTFGNTASSQYGQVRFTFGCTGYNASYPGLKIQKIFGFGGVGWTTPSNMAKYGRLYSYDYNQTAIFPAGITAGGQSVVLNNDSRLSNSRPASDVYSWAKASTKPDYNFSEIKAVPTTISGYGITDAYTKTEITTLLNGKQDKNIPYSAFASSSSGNYVPFLLYDSATGQYRLKRSNLAFAPNDAGARFFYLSAYGTWEEAQSGGSGGGDAYLANTQTFTGVNTFTQNVNLNRSMSSMTDPALTFNIRQNGAARIRVSPEGNPEQQTTTFRLQPTYLGGEEALLHTGNVKTINNQSIYGDGNISISGGSTSGNWELLRSRGASSSLTSVNSGTTSGSVSLTKSISQGDVLAIELNSTSSTSYNPIVLTITIQRISTNPNSYNYDYNLESFTSWTGTELRVNNFSISASGTNLYFGNKKYIKGSFSGSTIEWTTNQSYTLYVGRVWRLVQ